MKLRAHVAHKARIMQVAEALAVKAVETVLVVPTTLDLYPTLFIFFILLYNNVFDSCKVVDNGPRKVSEPER